MVMPVQPALALEASHFIEQPAEVVAALLEAHVELQELPVVTACGCAAEETEALAVPQTAAQAGSDLAAEALVALQLEEQVDPALVWAAVVDAFLAFLLEHVEPQLSPA
jgi:hypothetical protein